MQVISSSAVVIAKKTTLGQILHEGKIDGQKNPVLLEVTRSIEAGTLTS